VVKINSYRGKIRLALTAVFAAGAAAILVVAMGATSQTSRTLDAGSAARAQVASAPQAQGTAAAPTKGTVITLPSGKSVTLPKNWSQMTIGDLANLGIHANMRPSKALRAQLAHRGIYLPAMAAAPSASARPALGQGITLTSAYGCNKSVCISLTGSGWVIDNWYTTAYDAVATCTYAAYWLFGGIYATSNTVCSGANSDYYSDLGYGISTLGNTNACNTWVHIAGKPCEYVHN